MKLFTQTYQVYESNPLKNDKYFTNFVFFYLYMIFIILKTLLGSILTKLPGLFRLLDPI